jgi:hypothetical protein
MAVARCRRYLMDNSIRTVARHAFVDLNALDILYAHKLNW